MGEHEGGQTEQQVETERAAVGGAAAPASAPKQGGQASAGRAAMQRIADAPPPKGGTGGSTRTATAEAVPRGQYFESYYVVDGTTPALDCERTYRFNLKDVEAWGERTYVRRILHYHLWNVFGGKLDAGLEEQLSQALTGVQLFQLSYDATTYNVFIMGAAHRQIIAWVRKHQPALAPTGPSPGWRRLDENDTGRFDFTRFTPHATLALQPEVDKYVAGSSVAAQLHFDAHDLSNQLNDAPEKAEFSWSVWRGENHNGVVRFDERVAGGPSDPRGAYRFDAKLGAPGVYQIRVSVSSGYFKDGKLLEVDSKTVTVVPEAQRLPEVFDAELVDRSAGAAAAKPFVRDTDGTLKLKPGEKPLAPEDEVGELDVQIGAVQALHAAHKLSDKDFSRYMAYLGKQKQALEALRKEVEGKQQYVVHGTFVSRDTSAVMRVQAHLYEVGKRRTANGALYDVMLKDTTLGGDNVTQHPGNGWAPCTTDEQGDYAKAERDALTQVAEHWHAHNDYPNGKLRLAVQTLEGGALYEQELDTHNAGKTARTVLSDAALVAGGLSLVLAPFTAGASAAVGALIVGVGAVAMGAGATDMVWELEERYQKEGTIKADKRLALDVAGLAAMALGGAGSLVRFLGEGARVGAGAMRVYEVAQLGTMAGLDATQGILLSDTVHDEIAKQEAIYAVKKANAKDAIERADLEREERSTITQILGGAAVNGAFLIVSLGHTAKSATAVRGGRPAASEAGGKPGEEPPPDVVSSRDAAGEQRVEPKATKSGEGGGRTGRATAARGLLGQVEANHPYTLGHSNRVAEYAQMIAEALGTSNRRVEIAGRLHDVGKAQTPVEILDNTTPRLPPEKMAVMQQHTTAGANMVTDAIGDGPLGRWLSDAARSHHERWDGKGYPDGLKGTQIPLQARIIAVADAFDAMTSQRSYNEPMSFADALEVLKKGAGAQWDPDVVDAFTRRMADKLKTEPTPKLPGTSGQGDKQGADEGSTAIVRTETSKTSSQEPGHPQFAYEPIDPSIGAAADLAQRLQAAQTIIDRFAAGASADEVLGVTSAQSVRYRYREAVKQVYVNDLYGKIDKSQEAVLNEAFRIATLAADAARSGGKDATAYQVEQRKVAGGKMTASSGDPATRDAQTQADDAAWRARADADNMRWAREAWAEDQRRYDDEMRPFREALGRAARTAGWVGLGTLAAFVGWMVYETLDDGP